jgi:replication initiation and membrane attachment protein
MDVITLLPADRYLVVNKTILTEEDKKILIALYEPIVGPISTSLYLTLWHDLEQSELFSSNQNHHHLMSILKCNLKTIKQARESLEALGLLKTFVKTGSVNEYIYEVFSPLTPSEFFNHPILNIVLYNNIGDKEYQRLKTFYQKAKFDTKDYEEITKQLDDVFDTSTFTPSDDLREVETSPIMVSDHVDFDLIISSLPKGLINEKAFNKKTKELINLLSFIYNIDTLKMVELLRTVINEFGMIDKTKLRLAARKYYQFNNNSLPTLIYRSQPAYLKTPDGDASMRGKIIAMFENTSPYDFLKSKNKGINPTSKDLKLLESLLIDMELQPAVVNVLIDYVLRKNNNKLITNYVETIASQWSRAGLKTAKEAMEFAEKENKKMHSKVGNSKEKAKEPVWFNKNIEKQEVSESEKAELEELLKEFK